MKQSQEILFCDFCLKSQHDVEHIVVGGAPRFPAACGECIGLLITRLPAPAQLPDPAAGTETPADSTGSLNLLAKLQKMTNKLGAAKAHSDDVSVRLSRIARGVSEESK